VRILSGDDRASGVLIGTDGLILTVSHAVHEAANGSATRVSVIPHSGKPAAAELVARDKAADLALLRLTELHDDIPESIPLQQLRSPTIGETVLSCGYPGRESGDISAPVRIGRIMEVHDLSARSTCTLTAGDSGGPLTDVSGRLLGLNRRIGATIDQNHHSLLKDIWRFLGEHDVNLSTLHADTEQSTENTDSTATSAPIPVSLVQTDAIRQFGLSITVQLFRPEDNPANSPTLATGTLLNGTQVATKLSLLGRHGSLSCLTAHGVIRTGRVVTRSQPHDLAIISLSEATDSPEIPATTRTPPEGTLVFSPTVSDAGMISRSNHDEPGSVGKLGGIIRRDQNQLIVSEVSRSSTLSEAGIRPNDQLISIEGQGVSSLDDLAQQLSSRQPGDWVFFRIARDGQQITRSGRLHSDPANQFTRTEHLDGRSGRLSDRRTGFADVLQHDLPIRPEDCGGPLLDSSGRLIGINIARRARESTLALPIDVVSAVAANPR
jgi:serine protease Do